jgi:hypothetical protein
MRVGVANSCNYSDWAESLFLCRKLGVLKVLVVCVGRFGLKVFVVCVRRFESLHGLEV